MPRGVRDYWTAEEMEILRTHRHLKAEDVRKLLPGRSLHAVHHMRHRTRLQYVAPPPVEKEPDRVVGRPFVTASGVKAMMLPSGPVPYLHCLYGED